MVEQLFTASYYIKFGRTADLHYLIWLKAGFKSDENNWILSYTGKGRKELMVLCALNLNVKKQAMPKFAKLKIRWRERQFLSVNCFHRHDTPGDSKGLQISLATKKTIFCVTIHLFFLFSVGYILFKTFCPIFTTRIIPKICTVFLV